MTYNDGERSSKVVQETPFSRQLLCIAQLRQTSFILDLEVDLRGRHGAVLAWLCGRMVNVIALRRATTLEGIHYNRITFCFLLRPFPGEYSLQMSPMKGQK